MLSKIYLSKAISWQSYDVIDLLFILNHANHNFYYFRETSKTMIECILNTQSIEEVIRTCKRDYEVEELTLRNSVNDFILLLKQEGILYD